jgi:formamidase
LKSILLIGIKDMKILLTLFISSFFALSVFADTTDQKWMNKVEVTKKGDHCADDINCFNRYHPAIPPVAKANPGDIIIIHSRDALDSQFRLDSINDDLSTVDLGLVHPMMGPVHINGAKRGDALEVELIDIIPDEYGYTVIAPGFGFLRDLFPDPYIVNWKLTRIGAVSDGMPGIQFLLKLFQVL